MEDTWILDPFAGLINLVLPLLFLFEILVVFPRAELIVRVDDLLVHI